MESKREEEKEACFLKRDRFSHLLYDPGDYIRYAIYSLSLKERGDIGFEPSYDVLAGSYSIEGQGGAIE